MAKLSARNVSGTDARRFGSDWQPRCLWRGCHADQFEELPVCHRHAVAITARMIETVPMPQVPLAPPREWAPQPFVYYLALSPTTVKIGTTSDLRARINQLRTEAQYVVAIERGSFDLERQRHLQFAVERRGRREDFFLSEDLKRHIDSLQPERDALLKIATTYPLTPAA